MGGGKPLPSPRLSSFYAWRPSKTRTPRLPAAGRRKNGTGGKRENGPTSWFFTSCSPALPSPCHPSLLIFGSGAGTVETSDLCRSTRSLVVRDFVPRLIVIHGADEGKQFDLDQEFHGIGREASNSFRLHDTEVSRRHAELRQV